MSLYTDPDASVPYCIGIINTAIVIPESAMDQFDEEELDMVFAHEIAHIKNRDNLILVLQRVIEAIHWWNPVVKKLSGCLSISRELLADREACIYGNPRLCADGLSARSQIENLCSKIMCVKCLTGFVHHTTPPINS